MVAQKDKECTREENAQETLNNADAEVKPVAKKAAKCKGS